MMKIVLHICCGVCAAGVVDRLTLEGHEVLGLFYNPNIHPLEEYYRRREATHKVAKELNIPNGTIYLSYNNMLDKIKNNLMNKNQIMNICSFGSF